MMPLSKPDIMLQKLYSSSCLQLRYTLLLPVGGGRFLERIPAGFRQESIRPSSWGKHSAAHIQKAVRRS